MGYVLVHTSLLKDCAAYVEEQREYVDEDARAPENTLLAEIDQALQNASTEATGPIIHHAVRDEQTGQTRHIYVHLESGGVACFVHDEEQEGMARIIAAQAHTFLDVYGGGVQMHVWPEGDTDDDPSYTTEVIPTK